MSLELLKKEILNNTFRVCLDSRLIKPGEYFVAIKGETFDGHVFIEQVLEKGAKGILEEDELYELAKFKLNHIAPKIIGITGSSGKTTTVSLATQLLSTKCAVCTGKLNTKLGLCINVINDMAFDCELFVAEMGMDRLGEISETVAFFPLDVAIMTTINETHAEKLGSVQNITKAKFEILEGLKPGGVAILNSENEYIHHYAPALSLDNVIWFGDAVDIDVSTFDLPGRHNLSNLLSVVEAAKVFGFTKQDIEDVLPQLTLPKGRLQFLEGINGSVVLDDSYNANPTSTCSALDVLGDTKGSRKIAVLGDMLELGEYSDQGHKDVADYLVSVGVDMLIAVGKLGLIIFNHTRLRNKVWLEKSTDFEKLLVSNSLVVKKGDVFLIKGSQGVRMERITKMLLKNPESASEVLVRQDKRWM